MKLSDDQIAAALTSLPGWERLDNALRKTFQCDDFAHSMDLVTHIAELAEEHDHHPDIDIRYDKVVVALSTHSAGGITDQDTDLARKIEDLAI